MLATVTKSDYIKKYHQEHPVDIRRNRKRWEENHPEEIRRIRNESARKRNQRLKFMALQAYSDSYPQCVRCGIIDIDVLTIDHMNGGGNKHRREIGVGSGTHFFLWLKKNDYPEGYQVLCWNCNVKKRLAEGT